MTNDKKALDKQEWREVVIAALRSSEFLNDDDADGQNVTQFHIKLYTSWIQVYACIPVCSNTALNGRDQAQQSSPERHRS